MIATDVEALLAGLCDDAAIFPPGNLPLERAVPAHLAHRCGRHAWLVGPLVVALKDLPDLAQITAGLGGGVLRLAVTVPSPASAAEAVEAVRRAPGIRLDVLEVAVPLGMPASAVVPALALTLGDPDELTIYVETPRDGRRDELLAELAGSPYLAKFRTGGVAVDLYPDEVELAGAIWSAVRSGVPFKATAGLHHAVRNTDPATGFEQHGFLNVLAATAAALDGADEAELVVLLGERNGDRLTEVVRACPQRARSLFRSFGTCSIVDPVTELAQLGLLAPETTEDLA